MGKSLSFLLSVLHRRRLLSIILLLGVFVFLWTISPVLAQGQAQVWGQRYDSGGYWGASAYVSTPDPSIPSGSWVAAPTGVTNTNDIWIESGPTKACDIDCGLHPYGSYSTCPSSSCVHENVDTSRWLAAGGYYTYQSNHIGSPTSKTWQSIFCPSGGCVGMITGNLSTDTLPYVASGGESSSSGVRWGSITTSYNAFKPFNSASWYSWCYTSVRNTVGGTISSCDTSIFSWTVSY